MAKAWKLPLAVRGKPNLILFLGEEREAWRVTREFIRSQNDILGRDVVHLANAVPAEVSVIAATESPSELAMIARDYMVDALTTGVADDEMHRTLTGFMEAYHEAKCKEEQAKKLQGYKDQGLPAISVAEMPILLHATAVDQAGFFVGLADAEEQESK